MAGRNVEAIYPLTASQKGMLFETLTAGDPGFHTQQAVWKVNGVFDSDRFARAWQCVIDRHSGLRAAFVWKDQKELLQIIAKRVKVPQVQVDLRGMSPSLQEEKLAAHMRSDRERGFELSTAPLMRLAVFRVRDDEYHVLWTFHHILLDGWSLPIIQREMLAFYGAFTNDDVPAPGPAPSYGNYFAWLKRQDLSQAERYWRRTLEGFTAPTPLGVPAGPEPGNGGAERFETVTVSVSEPTTSLLRSLARRHSLTLNTVVQGTWALLLARYSGGTDVVFGATFSGRPSALDDVESMTGMFINTLPVRIRIVRELPFVDLLGGMQADHAERFDFTYCSAGQVHEWSQIPGSVPLYESILVFENYPPVSTGSGSSASPVDMRIVRSSGAHTRHPLTILVTPDRGMTLKAIFDTERFAGVDIARMLGHIETLLGEVAADPTQPAGMLIAGIADEDVPRVWPVRGKRRAPKKRFPAPRTAGEKILAQIFTELLGLEKVGITDDFFALGGYSLLAASLLERINDRFGVDLPLSALLSGATVEKLARIIEEGMDSISMSPVVPLQTGGDRRPFFCVHGAGGTSCQYYALSELLGSDQPFYAFQDVSTFNEREPLGSIEEMAAEYIEAMKTIQPEGPYRIGGWSFGGVVAFEMARQLEKRGEEVSLLVLIAVPAWAPRRMGGSAKEVKKKLRSFNLFIFLAILRSARPYFNDFMYLVTSAKRDIIERRSKRLSLVEYFRSLWIGAFWQYLLKRSDMAKVASRDARVLLFRQPKFRRCLYVLGCHVKTIGRYVLQPYPGRITVLRAGAAGPDPTLGWGRLAGGGVDVRQVPGTHVTLMQPPNIQGVADVLRACLDADQGAAGNSPGRGGNHRSIEKEEQWRETTRTTR